MRDYTMTNELVCTWVAVTDNAGRTHMEARWRSQPAAVAASAA